MRVCYDTGGDDHGVGKTRSEQRGMWVTATDLSKSERRIFYRNPNEVLVGVGFDRRLEQEGGPYYRSHLGQPSIPLGVYFRMLLVGYFNGVLATCVSCWCLCWNHCPSALRTAE